MDGASNDKKRVEKSPNSKSNPEEMREWLTRKTSIFREMPSRPELYELIARERNDHIRLRTKVEAEKFGQQVWFTPPYHPRFNSIEGIWAHIKNTLLSTASRTAYELLGNHISDSQWKVTSKHWVSSWNDSMNYLNGFYDNLDQEDFIPDESGSEFSEDDDQSDSES